MSKNSEVEFGEDEKLDEPTNILLEDKYRSQMRQIHPQKIELPISTLPQMIRDQIKLNPDFQRRDRWDNKKRSRFIESIIMNVPIPPVFLGEDDYGSYVVLDGRQRLTAIHEFLRNTYSLEGLTVWSELNDLRYSDLEEKNLQRTLTRRFVPTILLLKESSPEVKYDVFDRLNTGGVKANEMEIRNAIFQGEFNRLLHNLSGHADFRVLWDIPNSSKELQENTLYSQMKDVELVLRFFVTREPEKISGRLKDYLGEFMKARNSDYVENPNLEKEDTELFLRAITCAKMIFGAKAFERKSPDEKFRKSAPLADAVLAALSILDPSKLGPSNIPSVSEALANLFENDSEFIKAISSGTNGKGAITYRVNQATAVVMKTVPNAILK